MLFHCFFKTFFASPFSPDPNQTVQLTPNEYQLGLEAAREFTLRDFQENYRTERIVFDDQKSRR